MRSGAFRLDRHEPSISFPVSRAVRSLAVRSVAADLQAAPQSWDLEELIANRRRAKKSSQPRHEAVDCVFGTEIAGDADL
jgi:hypothetical protein